MPLWLISSVGSAVFVLGILLWAWPMVHRAARPLADLGRLAFTFYVAHFLVIAALGGRIDARVVGVPITVGLVLVFGIFATVWVRRLGIGPLERASGPAGSTKSSKEQHDHSRPTTTTPYTSSGAHRSLGITLLAGCTDASTPQPTGPIEVQPRATWSSATSERPALGAFGASTGHPLATDAAMGVLRGGGNAVDAAIAAAFADAVMQPASSGIGGGGVSIVARDGTNANHDYREVVPTSGVVPASGVGVPGFVAGMADLHDRYGTVDWAHLLEPAITLAEDGGPVSQYLADILARPGGVGWCKASSTSTARTAACCDGATRWCRRTSPAP